MKAVRHRGAPKQLCLDPRRSCDRSIGAASVGWLPRLCQALDRDGEMIASLMALRRKVVAAERKAKPRH